MGVRRVPPLMHLARFVDRHPPCRVGRPDLLTPSLGSLFSLLGMTLALFGAWHGILHEASGAALLWILLSLGLAPVAFWTGRRALAVFSLFRGGRSAWALGDDALLLVDREGNSIEIALDRLTGMAFSDGELRLMTDSEAQGPLYAIAFRLFDDELPHPAPEDLYEALLPHLEGDQAAPQDARAA